MTLVSYACLALTWGASFLFMKLALHDLAPGQVATGRLLLGALTLVGVMLATRRRWPREPRLWLHLAVVGLFMCALPFLLFAWSGQFLPSGLSSILNATTPLWTTLFTTLAIRETRLTRWQLLGLLLGTAGVAVVMGIWQLIASPAFAGSLGAQLACLGATASYGIAFTWMRRFVIGRYAYDAPTLAALQVCAGAAIALAGAGWFAGPIGHVAPDTAASMLLLGCLGTGFAYIWNTRVITAWGPVAASTVTYLVPVVGVALGALVLAERIAWYQPAGGLAVLVGVLLAQKVLPRRRATTRLPGPTARPDPVGITDDDRAAGGSRRPG